MAAALEALAADPSSLPAVVAVDVLYAGNTDEAADARLAQALWDESHYRECRMAAPMLYPVEEFTMDDALNWCNSLEGIEIADVLCHRLLRHLPFAPQLCDRLLESEKPLPRYAAWRLLLNLLLLKKIEDPSRFIAKVEQELQSAPAYLHSLLQSIMEECC